MLTDVNKSRVNLTIDPNVLILFKTMEPIHEKTLSGFLEEKILELATEKAPDLIMEREAKIYEEKARQLRDNITLAKTAYSQLREYKKHQKEEKENEELTDHKWIDRFDAYQSSNITMVNRRDQDFFKKAATEWGFKSASEANEKITEYVKSLGAYGCKACKKWNQKTTHCSQQNRKTDDMFSCRSWVKR